MKNNSIKVLVTCVLLLGIFVTAIHIRLSPVLKNPETMRAGLGPFGDSFLYHVLAYNLFKGNGFSGSYGEQSLGLQSPNVDQNYEPAVTRGPVYPYFMSMVYRIWGNEDDMDSFRTWHKNWDKVRVVQCMLDAMVCILVFFITWTIISNTFIPALLSSGLYCFSLYNIYYTRALLTESVTTFLLTTSVMLCVLGFKYHKFYLWGLAGSVFGLVILTRSEYLLFPAILTIYMLVFKRKEGYKTYFHPSVFLLAVVVVVMPWTMRNFKIYKEFIPVTVGGVGANLFLGTCETNTNWRGWSQLPGGVFDSSKDEALAQTLYNANVDDLGSGNITLRNTDKSLMNLGIERIKKHPFLCIKRWFIKLPRLWYQFYIPMYRDREASGGYFILYFVLSIIAFWKSTSDERRLMSPIILLFMYLNLVFLPTHVEPRYGVGLMPGIICLASLGIWKVWQHFIRDIIN